MGQISCNEVFEKHEMFEKHDFELVTGQMHMLSSLLLVPHHNDRYIYHIKARQ